MRAAGAGLALVARVVLAVAAAVFLIIALAIILTLLGGNPGNVIVKVVTGAARFLAGPFEGLFRVDDPKSTDALNWGIAAFVYLMVGAVIAGSLRRVGR
jgi:hypothetical protein